MSEEASSPAGAARVADAQGTVVLHAESARFPDARAPATVTVQRDEAEAQQFEAEGLRTVTGLQVVDRDRLRLVGGDLDCRPLAMSTSDGGATWQLDDAFGFWSLVPGDVRGLVHSDGTATARCEPVTVSGIDLSVARVLCQDGRVFGTADGGEEWGPLGQAPSPLSVSYATPALGFASSRKRTATESRSTAPRTAARPGDPTTVPTWPVPGRSRPPTTSSGSWATAALS